MLDHAKRRHNLLTMVSDIHNEGNNPSIGLNQIYNCGLPETQTEADFRKSAKAVRHCGTAGDSSTRVF